MDYIIYPEGMRKLEESGLVKRLEDAHKGNNSPRLGHVSEWNMQEYVDDVLKKFNRRLSRKERTELMHHLRKLPDSTEGCRWEIQTDEEAPKSPQLTFPFYERQRFLSRWVDPGMEANPLLVLAGWYALELMPPKELLDFKKLGFSSLTELTGTFGALIKNRELDMPSDDRGLVWENTHPNGRVFMNVIGGNYHFDLLITQTDITPYETLDPLGNQVHYRPVFDSDRNYVASHHSTEPFLLVGLLKWIQQTKTRSEMLEDRGRSLLEWTYSLGQRGGGAAEHFFGDYDKSKSRQGFMLFDEFEMPTIEDTKDFSNYRIPGSSADYHYGMFVGENQELVILGHEKDKGYNLEPKAVYQPNEADDLLKGLFYQAARGLGRTSARQLMGHVQYKFSEKYQEDVERIKKFHTSQR